MSEIDRLTRLLLRQTKAKEDLEHHLARANRLTSYYKKEAAKYKEKFLQTKEQLAVTKAEAVKAAAAAAAVRRSRAVHQHTLMHTSIVTVQSVFRGNAVRKNVKQYVHSIVALQSRWRLHRAMQLKRVAVRNGSATVIQTMARTCSAVSSFAKIKSAAVTIQSRWRIHQYLQHEEQEVYTNIKQIKSTKVALMQTIKVGLLMEAISFNDDDQVYDWFICKVVGKYRKSKGVQICFVDKNMKLIGKPEWTTRIQSSDDTSIQSSYPEDNEENKGDKNGGSYATGSESSDTEDNDENKGGRGSAGSGGSSGGGSGGGSGGSSGGDGEKESSTPNGGSGGDNEANMAKDLVEIQMLTARRKELENQRKSTTKKYRQKHPTQFSDEDPAKETIDANKLRNTHIYNILRTVKKKLKLLESNNPGDREEYYRVHSSQAKTAERVKETENKCKLMVIESHKNAKRRLKVKKKRQQEEEASGSGARMMTMEEIIHVDDNVDDMELRRDDYRKLSDSVEIVRRSNREGVNSDYIEDCLMLGLHLLATKKILQQREPEQHVSVNDVHFELTAKRQTRSEEKKLSQLINFAAIISKQRVHKFCKDCPVPFSTLALGFGGGIDGPLDRAFTSLGENKCKIWSLPSAKSGVGGSGGGKRNRNAKKKERGSRGKKK